MQAADADALRPTAVTKCVTVTKVERDQHVTACDTVTNEVPRGQELRLTAGLSWSCQHTSTSALTSTMVCRLLVVPAVLLTENCHSSPISPTPTPLALGPPAVLRSLLVLRFGTD